MMFPPSLQVSLSWGMASMLVPLWPSSEALLRARAPGARDQAWMSFPIFLSASKKDDLAAPYFLPIFANSAK